MKIDLDAVEQAKRPLELFYSGCKSKETKQQYATLLKKIVNEFFEDILDSKGFEERVNEFVYKAQNDPKWATEIIIAMVKMLKARTELPEKDSNYLRPISFKNYFPPLRKLLDLNEVTIPWAKVTSQYPVMKDLDDSRGYTRDEIKKVLEHADAIDKAIVTIAASSGIRAGAFDFKWRHIRPVYLYNDHLLWEDDKLTESVVRDGKIACAMILIYEGEIESQFAFVTLECYNFIQNYKTEWIQKVGKEPKPDDPFLRSESIIVKPLSKRGVRSRVERLLEKAGLRQPLIKGKRRHEIPIMNGFRRFFNKANKESISKDSLLASLIKKEMMMGHVGLIKLDKNYFKAHVNELLEEYLNAVPNLTIDDSEKLKLQNRAKDEKINQLELEKDAKIAQLERDMAYVKKLLIQTKKDNSSS
ncbi:MAG: integrase [Nitrosotalea sp.]